MKFMLIIAVCSFLIPNKTTCQKEIEYPQIYNTWDACVEAAFLYSMGTLNRLGHETVNKYQLATKFYCVKVNEA